MFSVLIFTSNSKILFPLLWYDFSLMLFLLLPTILKGSNTHFPSISNQLYWFAIWSWIFIIGGFPGSSAGNKSTCNAGDSGLILGSGRSPGGGHGNPLQYSCLANSHGQRSLVGYSSWGCKELDMTKWLRTAQHSSWEGTLGTGETTKSTFHFLVETYQPWVFMSQFSSVQFSRSVMSDSLQPHELQYARPPCPSPLPEFTQTHVHWVGDAIQSSHPRSSPSPPAPNPSQHQSLFQWVNSLHEVAKVLELQL